MTVTGMVLVGDGAPASDCPPYLIFKLKQLAARRHALGGEPNIEEAEIDQQIRTWPRTEANDRYKAGLEALGQTLRNRFGSAVEVALAYCEYCAPTLAQAVDDLIGRGVRRIVVIPAMLVPGSALAESDIRSAADRIGTDRTDIEIIYAWPFDLEMVATFLAEHFEKRNDVPAQSISSRPDELKTSSS